MRLTMRSTIALFTFALLLCTAASHAAVIHLRAALDGAQAATASSHSGLGVVTFNTVTKQLSWTITFSGLTGSFSDAHFHGPAAAGVDAGIVVPISGNAS